MTKLLCWLKIHGRSTYYGGRWRCRHCGTPLFVG